MMMVQVPTFRAAPKCEQRSCQYRSSNLQPSTAIILSFRTVYNVLQALTQATGAHANQQLKPNGLIGIELISMHLSESSIRHPLVHTYPSCQVNLDLNIYRKIHIRLEVLTDPIFIHLLISKYTASFTFTRLASVTVILTLRSR